MQDSADEDREKEVIPDAVNQDSKLATRGRQRTVHWKIEPRAFS